MIEIYRVKKDTSCVKQLGVKKDTLGIVKFKLSANFVEFDIGNNILTIKEKDIEPINIFSLNRTLKQPDSSGLWFGARRFEPWSIWRIDRLGQGSQQCFIKKPYSHKNKEYSWTNIGDKFVYWVKWR